MSHYLWAVSLFLFFGINHASAATLYLDPGVATLNRGDAITLSVRLMPDQAAGECINAIDAVITYTDNIQPVDVSIGRSIFSVWLEEPVINKENHTITLAGGIPNGYCGRVEGDPRLTNVIADIVLRSPGMQVGGSSDSQVVVEFGGETQALLNDGQGTIAPLTTLGATLTLSKEAGSELVDVWRESVRADALPPQEFSITLTKDDVAFNGKHFIVFGTSDKQTGMSHYEVMEEPVLEFSQFKWGGVGVPWVKATSPYVLEDQTLNSIIRVKAVDKAGNEYVATYIPDESLQTLSRNEIYTYVFFAGITLVLLLSGVAALFWWKRRRGIKEVEDTSNEVINEIEE